jgi:hypothetical protein
MFAMILGTVAVSCGNKTAEGTGVDSTLVDSVAVDSAVVDTLGQVMAADSVCAE